MQKNYVFCVVHNTVMVVVKFFLKTKDLKKNKKKFKKKEPKVLENLGCPRKSVIVDGPASVHGLLSLSCECWEIRRIEGNVAGGLKLPPLMVSSFGLLG